MEAKNLTTSQPNTEKPSPSPQPDSTTSINEESSSPPSKQNHLLLTIAIILTIILVGAGGIFFGKYIFTAQPTSSPETTKPPAETNPLTSPTPIPTIDPTADWKTYNTPENKYSIKYPSNMTIYAEGWLGSKNNPQTLWETHWSNKSKEDTASSGSDYSFYIQINPNPKNSYGGAFTKSDLETIFLPAPGDDLTSVSFQGYPAKRYQSTFNNLKEQSGTIVSYQIFDGKNLVHLIGSSENSELFSANEIDQILSTFKFLD